MIPTETFNQKVISQRLVWADFSLSPHPRLCATSISSFGAALHKHCLSDHWNIAAPVWDSAEPEQQATTTTTDETQCICVCRCHASLRMYQKCHIYSHENKKIIKENTHGCCLHTVSVTASVITHTMASLCGCECEQPWQMIEYKCKKTPVGGGGGRLVTDTHIWIQNRDHLRVAFFLKQI